MAETELKIKISASDEASRVLTGIDSKIQGMKNQLRMAGAGMLAVGGAITATAVMSLKSFANMGDEVAKLSAKTGFSTESLSEWRHVLELSGASLGTLETSTKRMSSAIIDAQSGLAESQRAFDQLGLSIDDIIGLSPEEQFEKIAYALAGLEDHALKSALAQDLFGRSGTELLPMLSLSKEEIAGLKQETHDLGEVFNLEAANSAVNLKDALKRVDDAMNGLKMVIAEQLVPVLMPLIESVKNIVKGVQDWAKEHPELFRTLTIITTALGALLVPLGTFLIMLPMLSAGILTLTGVSAPWLIAIGGIVVGLGALVAVGVLVYKNWDTICQWAAKVGEWFVWLKDSIIDFGKNALDWLKHHWDILLLAIFPFAGVIVQLIKHWDDLKAKFIEVKDTVIDFGKNAVDWLRERLEALIEPFKQVYDWISNLIHGSGLTELQDELAKTSGAINVLGSNLNESLSAFDAVKAKTDSLTGSMAGLTGALANVAIEDILGGEVPATQEEVMAAHQADLAQAEKRGAAGQIRTALKGIIGLNRATEIGNMLIYGEQDHYAPITEDEKELLHKYHLAGYKYGGEINEPTLLFGLASRRPYAVAHKGEYVTPGGGANVFHIHVDLDGREITEVVAEQLGKKLRLQGMH